MTLCVIVSAYGHASLTNVSQIFHYTNILLKRCSKIGRGDVLLFFQDTYGSWTTCKWMNWIQPNGRKFILNQVAKQQNLCVQQLQQQQVATSNKLVIRTMLQTLKECLLECKSHQQESSSSLNFVYHIALIGNEHCLSFKDDIYLNAHKSNIKSQEILSLARKIPLSLHMLCLCSPLQNKAYQEFNLNHNCCNVCTQEFFRTKPNKKQHFPKSCHQIALKQIKVQNICKQYESMMNDNKQPPLKKRKMNAENEKEEYERTEIMNSCAILFWQSLIDDSSGIFRWILTDFNQSNIDLVFSKIANKIASHSKQRYLAMGQLMAQCMIFPGPNNNYFFSPNHSQSSYNIIQFQSLNEKQIEFEINQQIKCNKNNCNPFLQAIYDNMNSSDSHNRCPFNILHESNVNVSQGCDVLSIIGFLDRENYWLSIPILSRHYVIPSGNKLYEDQNQNNASGDKANGADLCLFLKEMLYKHNKIALVNLNPANKASWFGYIHCDLKSKEKHLLLDILSPYINMEQLLLMEHKAEAMPQYKIENKKKKKKNSDNKQSMLNIFDSVAGYFPSETNLVKEFDKFIRLFKQKKVLECFEVAENIRKRSFMFHIPHLMTHLSSIAQKERSNVSLDLPKQNQLKHKLDVLLKLINDSQKDYRVTIIWNPPNKMHNKKTHPRHKGKTGKQST